MLIVARCFEKPAALAAGYFFPASKKWLALVALNGKPALSQLLKRSP
jgi:hypothetical protein